MDAKMKMKIDGSVVKECCAVMRRGGLILYPTDTVWGIGCDATNADAVARVYALKQRTDSKALIALADSVQMVRGYVRELPHSATDLYDVCQEGGNPLTLVLPGVEGLAANMVAEDGSVGFRIPDNRFCQMLLATFKGAVVSTSANVSGGATPARFSEISAAIIEGVDFVVPAEYEAGSSGKPSSIIKLSEGGELTIIR